MVVPRLPTQDVMSVRPCSSSAAGTTSATEGPRAAAALYAARHGLMCATTTREAGRRLIRSACRGTVADA